MVSKSLLNKADRGDKNAMIQVANEYCLNKQFDKALHYFQMAWEKFGTKKGIWKSMAKLYLKFEDDDKFLKMIDFGKSIGDKEYMVLLADYYINTKKYDDIDEMSSCYLQAANLLHVYNNSDSKTPYSLYLFIKCITRNYVSFAATREELFITIDRTIEQCPIQYRGRLLIEKGMYYLYHCEEGFTYENYINNVIPTAFQYFKRALVEYKDKNGLVEFILVMNNNLMPSIHNTLSDVVFSYILRAFNLYLKNCQTLAEKIPAFVNLSLFFNTRNIFHFKTPEDYYERMFKFYKLFDKYLSDERFSKNISTQRKQEVYLYLSYYYKNIVPFSVESALKNEEIECHYYNKYKELEAFNDSDHGDLEKCIQETIEFYSQRNKQEYMNRFFQFANNCLEDEINKYHVDEGKLQEELFCLFNDENHKQFIKSVYAKSNEEITEEERTELIKIVYLGMYLAILHDYSKFDEKISLIVDWEKGSQIKNSFIDKNAPGSYYTNLKYHYQNLFKNEKNVLDDYFQLAYCSFFIDADSRDKLYLDFLSNKLIPLEKAFSKINKNTDFSSVVKNSNKNGSDHTSKETLTNIVEKEKKDESLDDLMNQLNGLIGLSSVKENINQAIAHLKIQKIRKQRGLPTTTNTMHLVFTGNPGTGKTTVARLLGKIYCKLGCLSKGTFTEVTRKDLVGQYIGRTAIQTKELVEKCIGGVLFIDEAYTLANKSSQDFGQEAIAELIAQMENHRDDLMVIVAGYTKEMQEFLDINPGLSSRFSDTIEFEDYTAEELAQIFELTAKKEGGFTLNELAKQKLNEITVQMVAQKDQNFGNGRDVRNLFQKVTTNLEKRLEDNYNEKMSTEELQTIFPEDFENIKL